MIPNPPGVLKGPYPEFSSKWYTKVGGMLITVMIMESIIAHVPQLIDNLIKFFIGLWDRGCTRDRKKSKAALQREYEEIY